MEVVAKIVHFFGTLYIYMCMCVNFTPFLLLFFFKFKKKKKNFKISLIYYYSYSAFHDLIFDYNLLVFFLKIICSYQCLYNRIRTPF